MNVLPLAVFVPRKIGVTTKHTIFFNLEPRIRAEFFGKFKSLTRSFSSAWINNFGCWSHSYSEHSVIWLSDKDSSLTESSTASKYLGGNGIRIPGPWGTGRMAEGKLGYWMSCLFLLLNPATTQEQKYHSFPCPFGSLHTIGTPNTNDSLHYLNDETQPRHTMCGAMLCLGPQLNTEISIINTLKNGVIFWCWTDGT